MQFQLARRDFEVSFFLTIIYLLILSLLISLGFWQLERATEKRLFLQQQQQRIKSILNLTSETEDNLKLLRYRAVMIEGHYEPQKQFLIDNQIVKGKAGYFVMTPFVLKHSTKAVLINRGWLQANPDRSLLPDIALLENQNQIVGRINNFPSVGLKLQGAEIPTEGWPSVVQVAESKVLAKKLGYDLFSFQVELDPMQPQGYNRQWLEKTIMPPEKHIGYAVQWFGLAITLTFLFFWHSRKKQLHD
jgi:surfeit locus 1 family protein